MKLINEKLRKYKFILFIIIIIIEISGFIIVLNLYQPIYEKTFELTRNFTINKTLSASKTLKELSRITFYKQLCDLKLIGKHMSFLGNETNENKYIKRNSQFFDNILKNKNKQIVYGTMEELKKIPNLYEKFYNEENKKFYYFSKYNKDYIEAGKGSQIMNYLKNNNLHPELDMIAYYKLKGSTNISLIDDKKKRAAKYLISILKTNFIKRFIPKGVNCELLNYLVFVEDEMYIYPPEAFNNTHLFYITNIYLFNCGFMNAINTFPKCVYEYLNNRDNNYTAIPGYFRPILFGTKINFVETTIYFCINIPFENYFDLYNLTYNPLLCQESNLTKFFIGTNFEQKEGFEFIIFIYNLEKAKDIVPLFNGKIEIFEEIKYVFQDEKFKNYSTNSINRYFNHFSLFHLLYLDIFRDENIYKNLNNTIDEIIEEYEEIRNKIYEQLSIININIKKNNGTQQNNTESEIKEDYKLIEIEKTICKSDIYWNNVKCSKDTFIFIISPIYLDFYFINEDFLDDQRFPINVNFFYSLAIINNNNKYMKWKIKNIMLIKIIKLFIFYFVSSSCAVFVYFLLVQLFFETKYNVINQISNVINDGLFFEINDKNEIIE